MPIVKFSEEETKYLRENLSLFSFTQLVKNYNAKFHTHHDRTTIKRYCEKNFNIKVDNQHHYTKEELEWIKSNANNYSFTEIAKEFNARFNLNLSKGAIYRVCIKYKEYEKVKKHSSEELNFVKENINNYTYSALAKILNEKYNSKFNSHSLKKYCYGNNLKKEKDDTHKNARKPIGHEAIFDDTGIIYVKVKDEKVNNGKKNYRPKKDVIYEKHYGIKLKENDVVIQLDGDRENFNIDNLYLTNRNIMARCVKIMKLKNVQQGKDEYKNLIKAMFELVETEEIIRKIENE